VIAITADDERLMCGGSSLGKTVRLGNFEFIADYFSGVEGSLQHLAKVSISSPWDFPSNQLSHIPNSIFF
jgi:hypothetical protein